eukprot:symbB.v1.2.018483.t3/scaffold1464.1/size117165/6
MMLHADIFGIQTADRQSDEGLDVALLADKIGEEAHSLSDVLSWMEKRGVCWGLPDQRKFARFCEAMELLPGTSGTQENCNLSPVQDELEQSKKEPEDQHFCSLLQRRIDKNVLAKVLSLPPLPEDHSEVQMLMTHFLFSRNGQVIPNLKQQVSSHSDSIDVLRGRLEILESSMPSAWSPPVELWEDLMGSSPPSGLKAVDALTIVSEAVARRKAVRNGEEAAVASEALKASAAEKLRQVVWAESQEADIELLKQHLHEQAAHIKELEGERREGRSRAHLLNMMDAQEVARRANALCLEHHAAKVQRAWRQQQAKARLQLKAVLLLQFQMRRWRKRRQSAAKRIQERWSVFQKMKRRVEGAMNQSAAWMGKQFGTQTKDAADKNAKKAFLRSSGFQRQPPHGANPSSTCRAVACNALLGTSIDGMQAPPCAMVRVMQRLNCRPVAFYRASHHTVGEFKLDHSPILGSALSPILFCGQLLQGLDSRCCRWQDLFQHSFQIASKEWSSGSPCQAGECFVPTWGVQINKSARLFIAWISAAGSSSHWVCGGGALAPEFETVLCSSERFGHFSETLRLQLMDPDGRDSNSGNVWRTAAEARNLTGGLAVLRLKS